MPSSPASKTICIHIGTHKTGTTSIQAFLASNRERLRLHGVYVPRAGTTDPRSGHHNLAWQLRGDPRYDPECGTLDDLLAELGAVDERHAVISSEDFEYCVQYPEQLTGLEQMLRAAGWEPWYLVLFRDQPSYAVSLHAELLRHGLTASFPRFVAEIVGHAKFIMKGDWCFYFDYAAFLERWGQATSGTIRVRSFVSATADGLLLDEFLDALGVPAGALTDRTLEAERLNAGRGDGNGLGRWLAGKVIECRFARANIRLRRRYGIHHP